MRYYLYRFLDLEGNIVYVGKTRNIINRIKQHFSKQGHLEQNCYENVDTIEYIKLPSKIDMDIKELYYINKWKPIYNNKDKQDDELNLQLNESDDEWIIFKAKNEKYIEELEIENKNIKQENTSLILENDNLKKEITQLKDSLRTKERAAPIFITNSETRKINEQEFTFEEIKELYGMGEDVSFLSVLSVNGKAKYRFMIYKDKGDLYIKELSEDIDKNSPLGKTLNYSKDKIGEYKPPYYWKFLFSFESAGEFMAEEGTDTERLRNILLELDRIAIIRNRNRSIYFDEIGIFDEGKLSTFTKKFQAKYNIKLNEKQLQEIYIYICSFEKEEIKNLKEYIFNLIKLLDIKLKKLDGKLI